MKKALIILLVLALALSVCACKVSDSGKSTKDEVVTSTAISTPYAELRTPENYVNNVKYAVESNDPYTLTFISEKDDAKLYSLIFNGEGDILLGTIINAGEYTPLYATVYPLDQKDKIFDENGDYQEGMYTVLTNLRQDYDFVDNEVVEKPDTFEIKTEVVTLYYPKKWQNKVDVKTDPESVAFSSNGTELFIVSFVDNGGYLLGEYKGHPIYLTLSSLGDVDPATEEYKEISEMQDDANIMLDILESDPDFVSAK